MDRPAKHWTDEHVLGARVHFKLAAAAAAGDRRSYPPAAATSTSSSQLSQLSIRGVLSSDEGLYRCRVDFQQAPTRNSVANLTVIGKKCKLEGREKETNY